MTGTTSRCRLAARFRLGGSPHRPQRAVQVHVSNAPSSAGRISKAPPSAGRISQALRSGRRVSKAPPSREPTLVRRRGLTQAQIGAADGDAQTKLPDGLTRPTHWTTPKGGGAVPTKP